MLVAQHSMKMFMQSTEIDAIETAKARNPKARIISTNPDLSS